MNEYFNQEDEIGITDENFAYEAISYMQKEGLENCDEFLKDLERIDIAEEVCQPLVGECFTIIQNLMDIIEYIKDYRDPIPYFEKAINIISHQLQGAMDFYERHEYTECLMTDFITEDYEANLWYGYEKISDTLNKIFTITKESPKEQLNIYKQVTIPTFTNIKKISIDELKFETIEKAQEYINHQIFLDIEDFYYKNEKMSSINIVLCDKLEVFELSLNIRAFFKDVSYLEMTLLDAISEISIDLSFYTTTKDIPQYYEISLEEYSNSTIKRIDLRFLHEDIFNDMHSHLIKHKVKSKDIEPIIEFAFSTLKDTYTYQLKNDSSLEDKYLMLKSLIIDNFLDELTKYYIFDRYNINNIEKYGMYELERVLKKHNVLV